MRLNPRQADVLGILAGHGLHNTQKYLHTDEIRKALPKRGYASTTYDAIHSLLVRMEKKGAVMRTGKRPSVDRDGTVATWDITEAGQAAYAEYVG